MLASLCDGSIHVYMYEFVEVRAMYPCSFIVVHLQSGAWAQEVL